MNVVITPKKETFLYQIKTIIDNHKLTHLQTQFLYLLEERMERLYEPGKILFPREESPNLLSNTNQVISPEVIFMYAILQRWIRFYLCI